MMMLEQVYVVQLRRLTVALFAHLGREPCVVRRRATFTPDAEEPLRDPHFSCTAERASRFLGRRDQRRLWLGKKHHVRP